VRFVVVLVVCFALSSSLMAKDCGPVAEMERYIGKVATIQLKSGATAPIAEGRLIALNGDTLTVETSERTRTHVDCNNVLSISQSEPPS